MQIKTKFCGSDMLLNAMSAGLWRSRIFARKLYEIYENKKSRALPTHHCIDGSEIRKSGLIKEPESWPPCLENRVFQMNSKLTNEELKIEESF
jgi:hypothetical protein